MRHSGTREFNLKWWNRFTLKVSYSASSRRLHKQTYWNSPNSKNPTLQAQHSHSHSHKGLMTSRRPVAQHIVSRNFQVLRSLVVTRPSIWQADQFLSLWHLKWIVRTYELLQAHSTHNKNSPTNFRSEELRVSSLLQTPWREEAIYPSVFAFIRNALLNTPLFLFPWTPLPLKYVDGEWNQIWNWRSPKWSIGQPGAAEWNFTFGKRNAIYKRVFYFTVGFWSGLMKNFYKVMEARERHTPRSLRNIWQELFHKNRKRNPSRVLSSLVITLRDGFITTGYSSPPKLLTSARKVRRNSFLPLLKK